MKILHLIDSLSVGGAERVAVNYFNGLKRNGVDVYLCATRQEGGLKNSIVDFDGYLFLGKKHTFDFKALNKLTWFCRNKNIDIIHAHSSSLFLALMVKLLIGTKVIWHDHFGESEFLERRSSFLLRKLSFLINHVFVVNYLLKEWNIEKLNLPESKVCYLPNYAELSLTGDNVELPGSGYRIICLANLRSQKDHFTLFKAFKIAIKYNKNTHIILVGRDFHDVYSYAVKKELFKLGLSDNVFFIGERYDVGDVLRTCDIGILSSVSEGLPISLLEYGLAGLPVISSAVGEIPAVLEYGKYGFLFEPGNETDLATKLCHLIENKDLRISMGNKFKTHVMEKYSMKAIIDNLLRVYQSV